MAYSVDLRERALAHVASGESKAATARLFKIHRRTLFLWLAQPQQIPNKPGPRTAWKLDRQALLKLVQEQPDLMLKEMANTLQVSVSCVGATLNKLNIRRKKNAAIRASVQTPSNH